MAERAILFDFGGTLDSDGVAWPQRFFRLYREAGLEADWDAFLAAFYRSDDALPQRHALNGLDLEETVSLQAAAVMETLSPRQPELGRTVAKRFADESRRHFARNRPFLKRLRSRFRLAIVSNFYGNLEGILAAEGWRDLFDGVADSGAVGSIKPDAGIFRHALSQAGAVLEDSWMVGDSLSRDIRGAEALGLRHAWLAPAESAPCCASGTRIATLLELEDLVSEVKR